MSGQYASETEKREGIEVVLLRGPDGSEAEVVPEWGNNCIAFRAPHAVLEEVAFATVRERPTSYGIPILFPFPNRVSDGALLYRGRRYPVDPPRHGFVRDKPWKVLAQGASEEKGAWVRLGLDARDFPDRILMQFPFAFALEVTWRLRGTRLQMTTKVKNVGEQDLPFGFGIHPYLTCPDRARLQIPARRIWELAESLPTGRQHEVSGRYDLRHPVEWDGKPFDDILTDLVAAADGLARCVLEDVDRGLRTVVAFDARSFPEVVLYTTPAPRRAMCIEPYTCPTDVFNLGVRGVDSHLVTLLPGASKVLSVLIAAEA